MGEVYGACDTRRDLRQHDISCAQEAHIGLQRRVPESVPKRGPTDIIRHPTPTKVPMENGPEIVDFRPVL